MNARITWRPVVAFALLMAAVLPLHAESEEKLDRLIRVAAMDALFDNKAGSVVASFTRMPDQPGRQEFLATVKAAADETYSAPALKAQFRKEIRDKLTPEDIEAALTYYGTPGAERLAKLDKDSQAPTAYADFKKIESQIRAEMETDKPRTELYYRSMEALDMKRMGVEMIVRETEATLLGMAATNSQITPTVIAAELDKVRQGEARLVDLIFMSQAFTYRNADMEDLRARDAFITSPAASRLFGIVFSAKTKVVADATRAFGETVGRRIQASRPR